MPVVSVDMHTSYEYIHQLLTDRQTDSHIDFVQICGSCNGQRIGGVNVPKFLFEIRRRNGSHEQFCLFYQGLAFAQ